MKRRMIPMILSLLIALSACGSRGSAPADAAREGEKDSTGLVCPQSVYFMGHRDFGLAPDGCYAGYNDKGGHLESRSFLTYIDRETGEEIYLCGKPECSHVDENGDILESCDAFVDDIVLMSVSYYDGYVYFLKYDEVSYDVTLARVSQDGSVHEDLFVVGQDENGGSHFDYLIDGKYLYLVHDDPDIIRLWQDGVQGLSINLEKIDLTTGERTVVYTNTGDMARIGNLKLVGDRLYFLQYSKEIIEGGVDSYHLMCYNTTTGETEMVMEDEVYSYTIVGEDTIYYNIPTDGVYRYQISTGERSLVRKADEESGYLFMAYDGKYLYLDNDNSYAIDKFFGDGEGCELKIFVCTLEGELVQVIPECKGQIFTQMSDGEMVCTKSFRVGMGERSFYLRTENLQEETPEWHLAER